MNILSRLKNWIRREKSKSAFQQLCDAERYVPFVMSLNNATFIGPDGPSFYHSYVEIFNDRIYQFQCENESPTILDCGANIGLSVLFFKQIFPDCQLTAIEADPTIFNYLVQNLAEARISDVECLNKAVADKPGTLCFAQEGADGGRIVNGNDSKQSVKVDATTLNELIVSHTHFLKIDIEGAETAALLACEKLDIVDRIFVEYHSFVDQPQVLSALLRKLSDSDFRFTIHQQFVSPRPFTERSLQLDMDLQLNIFAWKQGCGPKEQCGF